VLAAHAAASGELCRALPTVLGHELEAHERLVVDGAWLLPSFVSELELPDTEVRAVYVVQRTEADVEAALIPRRGGFPLEDRHRLMNRRIFQYGAWLADEARAHDLPVVEALPFESLLDRARAALLPLNGPPSRRSWPPTVGSRDPYLWTTHPGMCTRRPARRVDATNFSSRLSCRVRVHARSASSRPLTAARTSGGRSETWVHGHGQWAP
jgi:hypothetical protein